MAFKMHTSVPDLTDFSKESKATLEAYGITWGSTDELGYSYIADGQDMDVHDLHATMLALCGIDHKRLTVRYQGRDFRLTDIHGRIIKGICA